MLRFGERETGKEDLSILVQGNIGYGGLIAYSRKKREFGMFDEALGEFVSFGINLKGVKSNWYTLAVTFKFLETKKGFNQYKVCAYWDAEPKNTFEVFLKSNIKFIGNSYEKTHSWGCIGELVIYSKELSGLEIKHFFHNYTLKGDLVGYENSFHRDVASIITPETIILILNSPNTETKENLVRLLLLLLPFSNFWGILYDKNVLKTLQRIQLDHCDKPIGLIITYILSNL